MPKPNPKKEEPKAAPAPAPVAAPVVQEPEYPTAQKAADRLQVTLQDGKIDLSSLRTANKERLQEVFQESLKSEDFRKFIGIERGPDAPPPAQIVSPQLIAGLFDTITNVQAMVYSKKTGIPFEEVAKLVRWTPEEHAFLDRQGCQLVNKYIPPKWLKYSDVTLFIVLVYSMMQNKAALVANYSNERMRRMGVPTGEPPKQVPAKAPEPPKAPESAKVPELKIVPPTAPTPDNGMPGGVASGSPAPSHSEDLRSLG